MECFISVSFLTRNCRASYRWCSTRRTSSVATVSVIVFASRNLGNVKITHIGAWCVNRFGDTMNTTARIESTSKPGRIQISKETGELVIEAGKGHWIEKREEKVEAKGKGSLETYWLKENYNRQPGSNGNDSSESGISSQSGHETAHQVTPEAQHFSEKTNRLVSTSLVSNYSVHSCVDLCLTLLFAVVDRLERRDTLAPCKTNCGTTKGSIADANANPRFCCCLELL